MKTTVHNSKYFYGHKISEYGLKNGYIDYATLSKAFDAVLVNDITKLFYIDINGEYNEPELVNGYIDNSDRIDELREQIANLEDALNIDENSDRMSEDILNDIERINDEITELEREQDELPEIYQYFIISDPGARILQEYTNDPIYYIQVLDCYVWGVTHWGTSWDYVLTDVKLNLTEGE